MTDTVLIDACVAQIAREALEQKRYTAQLRRWHHRPRYSLLQGKGSVLNADGSVAWEDEEWMPNALANSGEADMLNVYLKAATQTSTWYLGLSLVSTATTNRPSNTTTSANMTQTALAGGSTVTEQNTSNGYARQSVAAAGWGANSGTQPTATTAPQVTFGPATGTAWTGTTTSPGQIQDAFMSTGSSGTSGTFILFLALSATTSIALTQSFAYTLTFRQT
jgi:hypothetical protein